MIERGRDTVWGEAGYCPNCKRDCPPGPDPCIGLRPGVIEACCGHGDHDLAYVTMEKGPTTYYGRDALMMLGLPVWPMIRP